MSLHPWPTAPTCVLEVPDDPDGWGWLVYRDPASGRPTSLPVTRGPSRPRTDEHPPLWHVETPAPGQAITTPSIKVSTSRPDADGTMRPVELYHSPARVVWRIVDELEEGER